MSKLFILLIKQELNNYIWLEMSSIMTILKKIFLSKLTIFFYLNTIYCISIFLLIKIWNLSITKLIFDWNIIWVYFECFLDYLWSYLTKTRGVKDAKNIKSAFIKGIFARVVSMNNIFSLKTCVSIELFGISY